MTKILDRPIQLSIIGLISFFCPYLKAAPIPEEFWKIIDTISESAPKGIKSMAEIWPDRSLLTHMENKNDSKNINTEPFAISKDILAKSAEIRISERGSIRLITLGIDGICITSSDVKQRYPLSKIDNFPQPDNPDPVSYRFIELKGVEVSFEFRNRMPGCLTHVIFEPKEQ